MNIAKSKHANTQTKVLQKSVKANSREKKFKKIAPTIEN